MTFPKVRLAVSAALFLAWLGFLLFLVVDSRKVVLSKPQFLTAQIYVVVQVKGQGGRADYVSPDARVTVEKVLWSSHPEAGQLVGQELDLPDLASCTKQEGYEGAKQYLLPLVAQIGDGYQLAPVPRVDPFGRQEYTHGTVEALGFFSHPLKRRLPIAQAQLTFKELKESGYHKISLNAEELRIYPWTPDTRVQVKQIIAAKK